MADNFFDYILIGISLCGNRLLPLEEFMSTLFKISVVGGEIWTVNKNIKPELAMYFAAALPH